MGVGHQDGTAERVLVSLPCRCDPCRMTMLGPRLAMQGRCMCSDDEQSASGVDGASGAFTLRWRSNDQHRDRTQAFKRRSDSIFVYELVQATRSKWVRRKSYGSPNRESQERSGNFEPCLSGATWGGRRGAVRHPLDSSRQYVVVPIPGIRKIAVPFCCTVASVLAQW